MWKSIEILQQEAKATKVRGQILSLALSLLGDVSCEEVHSKQYAIFDGFVDLQNGGHNINILSTLATISAPKCLFSYGFYFRRETNLSTRANPPIVVTIRRSYCIHETHHFGSISCVDLAWNYLTKPWKIALSHGVGGSRV